MVGLTKKSKRAKRKSQNKPRNLRKNISRNSTGNLFMKERFNQGIEKGLTRRKRFKNSRKEK